MFRSRGYNRILQNIAKESKKDLEESLTRYRAYNTLKSNMDVQNDNYVMPSSLEKEQNREAMFTLITCLLSMLMIEIMQPQGKYY